MAASLASAPELQKNTRSMPDNAAQAIGQPRLQVDAVQVGGVHQLARLLADGPGDRRVGVAQAAHGNAGQGIEVLPVLAVPQPDAFTTLELHGQPVIGRHKMLGHGSYYPK